MSIVELKEHLKPSDDASLAPEQTRIYFHCDASFYCNSFLDTFGSVPRSSILWFAGHVGLLYPSKKHSCIIPPRHPQPYPLGLQGR